MRDWGIVVAILVVALVLSSFIDDWLERKNHLERDRNDFTGIKDEENTDDFLPW